MMTSSPVSILVLECDMTKDTREGKFGLAEVLSALAESADVVLLCLWVSLQRVRLIAGWGY